MDKTRFNEFVSKWVVIKPKKYCRGWNQLTENEQLDASLTVTAIPSQLMPCEDCGDLVKGRRCIIYNNRYTGVQGKRSQDDHWIKQCQTCGYKCDFMPKKSKKIK